MNFPNINLYSNNNQKIIVALSGGKDSSGLLHMVLEKFPKNKIIPVIINHNLREESSQEAEAIKKYWRKTFNIKVHIINWTNPIGKQVKAREFRLLNLAIFAMKNNSEMVFLGHNFEDKLETYLIRKNFYSTNWGLASISYKTTIYGIKFIRPLLFTSIDYIKNYIKVNNIKIFEDRTNNTNNYTRNIVRNQQMPLINKYKIANEVIQYVEERIYYMFLIKKWINLYLDIIDNFTSRFVWNRLPSNKKLASLILMYISEKIQGRRVDSYERFYKFLDLYKNNNIANGTGMKKSFHVNECNFIYRGFYVYAEIILTSKIFLNNEGIWYNKFLIIDNINQNRSFIFYNLLWYENINKGIFIFNNKEINLNFINHIVIDNFTIKYLDYNFFNEYT
jgi:tRNA(Ile)-lysidine synthetase-like protein